MNIKLFTPIVLVVALLIQSCTKHGNLSINGVKINSDTKWSDIIDDSSDKRKRDEIKSTAETLLLASRFDELEQMAETYRLYQEKFKNGEWALNTFYSGLSHYLSKTPGKAENWEQRLAKLKEWVESKPNSVTARIALSECLVGYAFAGRGSGYADSVTDEQWRLFNERLIEAQTALYESAEMRDKCPQWRAACMRFHGEEWTREKFEQVFKDAVAYNHEFSMYYFRTAIMLMPRWYGYEGDVEQFSKDVADFIGGKQGDILYAQIIWFLDRNYGLDNLGRLNPQIDWLRVKRGIESIS